MTLGININGGFKLAWGNLTTYNVISPLPQCLCPDLALYWWTTTHKFTWPFNKVFLWNHMANEKHSISTITIAMVTKLGMKWKALIHKFTRSFNDVVLSGHLTKFFISIFTTPMSAKHGEFMRGHQSYQDRDIQLGAPTRDKLDTLYIKLQKTYRHRNRQGVNLLWETFTFKVAWPIDYMTKFRSLVKLEKLYLHLNKAHGQ